MLFRQDALEKIRSGLVSLVFRRWRQARVRAGSRLRTAIGLIEVRSVDRVADVTENDAVRAGYDSAETLRDDIPGGAGHPLFRIEVSFAGADPRIALRGGRADRRGSGGAGGEAGPDGSPQQPGPVDAGGSGVDRGAAGNPGR